MDGHIDPRTGLEELPRSECLDLIRRAPIGRLGVVVGGRPLIFPVNFTLDGDAIVLRTDTGTKLYGARHGPVTFECDGIDATYHTGWSVIVLAEAEEVVAPDEIARLERLPLGPWSPRPKPVWLRLHPHTVTGRRIPAPGRAREEETSKCH